MCHGDRGTQESGGKWQKRGKKTDWWVREIRHTFQAFALGEINLLTLKIKMDLTQSMQKTKYKELCLKLLKNLSSMWVCLDYIIIINNNFKEHPSDQHLPDQDLSLLHQCALLWGRGGRIVGSRAPQDVAGRFTHQNWFMKIFYQILTGAESYQTQSWSYSVNNMRSYFLDKESLLEDVKDWSICI